MANLAYSAETEWNVKGLIQGHQDSALSQNGVRGAELLAKWISPVQFTHVVTSDLQRAVRVSSFYNLHYIGKGFFYQDQ